MLAHQGAQLTTVIHLYIDHRFSIDLTSSDGNGCMRRTWIYLTFTPSAASLSNASNIAPLVEPQLIMTMSPLPYATALSSSDISFIATSSLVILLSIICTLISGSSVMCPSCVCSSPLFQKIAFLVPSTTIGLIGLLDSLKRR